MNAIHPKIRNPCTTDTDCIDLWEYCKPSEEEPHSHSEDEFQEIQSTGICTHKQPFPMLLSEFIGCFVIVAALMITQAGGIAGGGSLIPILLGFFRFDA